jgi:nucleotide-binding universal stress UspA family protein
MQEIKRILVPTDFSEVSRAALSMGLQLASDHNAQLFVLHVIKDIDRELKKRLVSAPNDSVIETAITEGERDILDAVELERNRAQENNKPLKAVPLKMLVSGGDWLDVTLGLIDEHELDLIVTGTHGGRGIKGLLLGSMSQQLVRKASCSVFVVKPQGYPYLRD